MQGKFITFEGGEGCGKSTQIALLSAYLKEKNISHVLTKEPGSTPEGAVLRNMLVTGDKDKFDAVTESLLYFADRRCNLTKIVWPNMAKGSWVLSDRYADSTMAYQCFGYNKRIEADTIKTLYKITAGDFMPDLTFILDIDPEVGMRRSYAKAQGMEVKELRFESRQIEFHRRLREGFLEIARLDPQRCVVLNADKSIEDLHNDIIEVIEKKYMRSQGGYSSAE